ncbi:MAG: alpha-galactosidase [Microbacterium sp.]
MNNTSPLPEIVHLRRGGVSVIVRLDDSELPTVLHWGAAVPDEAIGGLSAALQSPVGDSLAYANPRVAVVPLHSAGWLGHPGLLGSRNGRAWSFAPAAVRHEVHDAGTAQWSDGADGAVRLRSVSVDDTIGIELVTELEVHPSGVVRLRASVRNLGEAGYQLVALEPALPVPASASELLDMMGRHTRERTPQRQPFTMGRWTREAWGGRPGHDSATVLCAGRPGFGFGSGPVWGVHVAWSGNSVFAAEKTATAWQLLRGGELLLPGEIILDHGAGYTSPWLVAGYGDGLDELEGRLHSFIRARPNHPRLPRPVTLNTWEAVYFDHDLPRLLDLADRAAEMGVERFVLDDGWFTGRRDDTAGLGDWDVDPAIWPEGLHPLSERVHADGMQFGLWFEPEMVNLDSDLARAHPEWIFATEHGFGIPSRYQHVLDLTHPDAFAHILGRISTLVEEYGIDYIKWDHNRPLVDAGHAPTFTPGVHQQTLATYRLIDELKRRHPGLEIESCCGGGGRIDLGIMDRCDRVWVSDCIDAHERQRLQRWTSLLLPPELLGTHIGAHQDHTTDRILDLDFRAGTAIWGHFGIEWDLAAADASELTRLREWIALHKELRSLLHTGTVVHEDPTNQAVWVEGVVAKDQSDAIYRMSVVDHSDTWPFGRITLPGLAPERRYHVSVQEPSRRSIDTSATPGWIADGVELTGAALAQIGIAAPLTSVDRLVLLRATAVSDHRPPEGGNRRAG